MSEKIYISAQQLVEDSYRLGAMVLKDGFKPNFIVGIWRGGTPVGIAVQELLETFGVDSDHISIRTSSYTSIGQCSRKIRVHGLGYLVDTINSDDRLLIVDDVYDTGLSIQAVIKHLTKRSRRNTPEQIRIATAYYKPSKNKTDRIPDYFVHNVNNWLVFPHELVGLTSAEILNEKPNAETIVELINEFGIQNSG